MRYKKYFRKTSLKQKGVGDFFLNEVLIKRPKVFLEVGVFHGVTARNVCELLYTLHGKDFKYIGLDLFEKSDPFDFDGKFWKLKNIALQLHSFQKPTIPICIATAESERITSGSRASQ